jgi:hypothetical protein
MTKEQVGEARIIFSTLDWLDSFIRALEKPSARIFVNDGVFNTEDRQDVFKEELLVLAKDKREKLNEKLEKL